MSIANYATDLWVVTLNGRPITDWGETATPFSDSPIDQKRSLRRGQGGNAIKLERSNPGRALSIYLNPGSPDSAYAQGLLNSGATITVTAQQIGTLETIIGTEGVAINDGANGRGGTTISDDQYMYEFNSWTQVKGGA